MMRLAFVLWCVVGLMGVSARLCAQGLPAHCDDPVQRESLQRLGPVVSVGASASSGLFAKSFPLLAAQQLCLSQGAGFESRHSFGGSTQFPFLKRMFIEQRPKVVVALDYLHHAGKRRRYTPETLRYLDAEIARLTLDCRHPEIDCSPRGEFNFVEKENYRPLVLLGDIYAFYALDCDRVDPFFSADMHDVNVGCVDDYVKINQYLWQKAREIPNLVIFPVDTFYRHLHAGLPFHYELDGRMGGFFATDLFWDGFHPRSEPGAQVLANLVLRNLNQLIARGVIPAATGIPYIPIDQKHFKPYTGLLLLGAGGAALEGKPRVVNEQGSELPLVFSGKIPAQAGTWGHEVRYERDARSAVTRVGSRPLALKVMGVTSDGAIVLAREEWDLLYRLLADPTHAIAGGIVVGPR